MVSYCILFLTGYVNIFISENSLNHQTPRSILSWLLDILPRAPLDKIIIVMPICCLEYYLEKQQNSSAVYPSMWIKRRNKLPFFIIFLIFQTMKSAIMMNVAYLRQRFGTRKLFCSS